MAFRIDNSPLFLINMTRTLPALLLSAALFPLSARAQSPKPATSAEVRLTEFAIPPFPVEVVSFSVGSGAMQLLTHMPVAGRPLPLSETPKPRGAEFPSSAAYLCRQSLDAQGQPTTPAQSLVFSAALPTAQPADFAVFGTRAADGPLRLPLGGLPAQFADQLTGMNSPGADAAALMARQVSLLSAGPGLNYANYKLAPRFRTFTRVLDPASGRLLLRADETAPQRAATEAKLPAYVASESSDLNRRGHVIPIADAAGSVRYEGLATRFVEGDKNASARNASLLSFDAEGNLLTNLPLTFAYNRSLNARLPVHDATGRVVGTLTVFGSGPGKKDAQDPDENRVEVVITDETGAVWSQFQWVAGGSSNRAIIPHYARRAGNQVLLYNTNQQKLLKPVEESWAFDKAGTATLLGSMPYDGIFDRSKAEGNVNGGDRTGWYNFTTGYYLDSFTGTDGSIWVLMQRQQPAFGIPGVSASQTPVVAGAVPASTSRLGTFANRLGSLSGMPQAGPSMPMNRPAPMAAAEPGTGPNDLFVLRFDDKLLLQSQTVVALRPLDGGPLPISRSLRPSGADLLIGDGNSIWLKMRGNTLTVQYLTLPQQNQPALGRSHAAFDQPGNTLYLLTVLPQKPGLARLNTYPLD